LQILVRRRGVDKFFSGRRYGVRLEHNNELLEHVVAVEGQVLAGNHPDRLASQHMLAIVYFADNQVEKAATLLEYYGIRPKYC
jgi:hypothetical protein